MSPPRILFITSNRLGDAVLSTGILGYLLERQPEARLTVACGALPAPLFSAIPQLERLIPLVKRGRASHWRDLWRASIGTRWDLVVDLRNSLFPWLVRARKRIRFGADNRPMHRVCQLAGAVGLSPDLAPAPRLWLAEAVRAEAARRLPPDGLPVLAIGPTANWKGKQWDPARFSALIDDVTSPTGALPGAWVAVFGAAAERPSAQPVLDAIPPERRLDFVGGMDVALAGACLERCALYVGNDSGLMHTACAAGIPTIGLFGPSSDVHYGPWGSRCLAVRTEESPDYFIAHKCHANPNPQGLLDSISVEQVLRAVDQVLLRGA
ncbi:ADP-heptose--LPS heptosyltransferase 2 [mine drainage metagenome]|uniref:ADP-heptose--LPS heptosyltransferase 2 n=1 Tax=mine drainage metagenome TaxID=410659 RepID=A0A1J5RDB2_9ZZZZ